MPGGGRHFAASGPLDPTLMSAVRIAGGQWNFGLGACDQC